MKLLKSECAVYLIFSWIFSLIVLIYSRMAEKYHEFIKWISTSSMLHQWLLFGLSLAVGWALNKIIRKFFDRASIALNLPAPVISILRPTISVIIWFIAIAQGLNVLGINITSILGAAGVLGVAIGFASQTSLSNVISGLFIITEKQLKIGDYIRVDTVEGSVESINLLAVWLRQVDNSLVRVPNSTLIQSPVINITGDKLRRCDFAIGVDYGSDLSKVRRVLLQVIDEQDKLASDPAPAILFKGFGDSSLDLHIGAWCKTSDYHDVRYDFAVSLLAAFKREDINIPFPCRTVYMDKPTTSNPLAD